MLGGMPPVDQRSIGSAADSGEGPAAHVAAVERWRRGRAERLMSPDGWLTLVDRILLDDGDNDTPIGRVRVDGERAWLQARTDVPVTIGGAPAGERELHTEDTGPLDQVVAEGLTYELSRTAGRLSLRVKDPRSPARRRFRGLTFFPIDPAWRVRARLEVAGPAGPGRAVFTLGERTLALTTENPRGARLVFIFGDETNRSDTYPGGRFLYADAPEAGEVVLDFNFAFNPPCAFTDHAICPALPPGNRLPLAVTAGERRYEEAT
jgi:uncharacterized protein (DUF1684 family)